MPFRDVIGHERPKQLLQAALTHDRVAHAYLFYGEDRIGKRLTAIRFAQAVNCDDGAAAARGDSCGVCRSCKQIEARTHPDALLIEPDPEQANPQIKIERVRDLESQIIYRPLIGRYKTILIDEADRMTIGAANALLKTLEEPPGHSLFVLVTARPYAMPATIRSRCQALRFVAPARTQVEAALIVQREIPPADARFLAMVTQGRLGEALAADVTALRAIHADYRALTSRAALTSPATILASAEALAKGDRGPEALDWLARWLRDVLLVQVGAEPDFLIDLERLAELKEAAKAIDATALLDLLAEIEALERGAGRNLNPQIALESLLLRIREAVAS